MLVEALSIKCMLNSKPIFRGTSTIDPGDTPGGGGGTHVQRGGRTRVTYFAEEWVFFKTFACPRFCKRRVLFCTQVRSMGGENPLTIHEIYAALTPCDSEVTGLPSLLPRLAATKQAEDYTI